MNDIEYLRNLNKELWRDLKSVSMASPMGEIFLKQEKRIILFDEFKRVCEILGKDNSIKFAIHNDCMGFGIGMSIFNHNERDKLLHINQKHFSSENRFDDAWPIFEQLAKRFPHKLTEPLREKSYYEY